ncbi:unnamed protein product, partial [Adineta steineri]
MSSSKSQSKNRNKNAIRKQAKEEKELLYSTNFPPYAFNHPYTINFINRCTTFDEIDNIISVARNSSHYTVDTESDYHTNAPAVIQVACFPSDGRLVVVLIIEVNFLADKSSLLFSKCQELFDTITRADGHIYGWGNVRDELSHFLSFSLFSFPLSSHFHNVQLVFTKWFNQWTSIQTTSYSEDNDNVNDDVVVINAPLYDPSLFMPANVINKIKMTTGNLWSIQDAMIYLFHQYVSKKETLCKWSIGLDYRLSHTNVNPASHRQHLILYAANDCLSLLQIILFIHEQHLSGYVDGDGFITHMGEYFSYLHKKYFLFSAVVKNQPRYDLLFNDGEDVESSRESMAVHDLHERCPISSEPRTHEEQINTHHHPSLHHQVGQRLTTADPTLIQTTITTTTTLFPSTSSYPLAAVNNQQFTSSVLLVEPEVSSDLALVTDEFQQDNKIVNEDSDIHQDIEVLEQSSDIQPSIKRKKSRRRRSQAAKLLRNQQSSIRHRRNRYIYEVIRDINCSVSDAKCILQCYDIKYLNINPVESK